MGQVSFKTKSGKKVSFGTGRKKKGRGRKVSAYNKHAAKVIRNRPKGQSVQTAMKEAARTWKE